MPCCGCCSFDCAFCNPVGCLTCNVCAPTCGGSASQSCSGTISPPPNQGCNYVQKGKTGQCVWGSISNLGYFLTSAATGKPILTTKTGQPYLGNASRVTGTVSASSVLLVGAAAVALIVIFGLGKGK